MNRKFKVVYETSEPRRKVECLECLVMLPFMISEHIDGPSRPAKSFTAHLHVQ
jgi:hypothetical protein